MEIKKKKADIEDLLATYADHIAGNYPDPEVFRSNINSLLEAKKKRMEASEYVVSLEKNIVFLTDLAVEGEAFLEMLLSQVNDESPIDVSIEKYLEEMESQVRASTPGRYRDIFKGPGAGEFEELLLSREEDEEKYLEKLSFNYIYLTTLRMLLFEFFNLLSVVRKEYFIDRVDSAAPRHILSHLEMTANYYLGNIDVAEVSGGDEQTGSNILK
ncbi:MAG: hypothetical protein JW814_06125 [Candidatus Krumholzibacteriota bacterium]|nr:hypothetical protein [Candidatus Krumholzibacteriota bacterium]